MTKPRPKYILNVQIEWEVAEKLEKVARHLGVTRAALTRRAVGELLGQYQIRVKGQGVGDGAKS